MNLPLPPRIRALTPYEPGKPVETLLREYGVARAVKLASNENPLGPSARALDAIARAAAGVHFYPDGAAWALRERLAARLGARMENVILGAGSNEILDFVARVYLEPGDEAVMSERAFVIYKLATTSVGARAVEVPMRDETHDLDAMAGAVGERTRVVFIANPNNPSGTRVGRAAWERFLARVPERVLVVMDEAYFEYARSDPDYPDSLEGFSETRPVLTLRTFSKAYGLAGLRVGYGVGPAEVVGALNRVRPPFNTTSPGQAAALAALEDEAHLARVLEANARGREQLEVLYEQLGLAYVPTWGNFHLVATGNDAVRLKGAELYERLLRMGVIVRPMGGYGYPDHVRISIGTEDENQALGECLAEIYRR